MVGVSLKLGLKALAALGVSSSSRLLLQHGKHDEEDQGQHDLSLPRYPKARSSVILDSARQPEDAWLRHQGEA